MIFTNLLDSVLGFLSKIKSLLDHPRGSKFQEHLVRLGKPSLMSVCNASNKKVASLYSRGRTKHWRGQTKPSVKSLKIFNAVS